MGKSNKKSEIRNRDTYEVIAYNSKFSSKKCYYNGDKKLDKNTEVIVRYGDKDDLFIGFVEMYFPNLNANNESSGDFDFTPDDAEIVSVMNTKYIPRTDTYYKVVSDAYNGPCYCTYKDDSLKAGQKVVTPHLINGELIKVKALIIDVIQCSELLVPHCTTEPREILELLDKDVDIENKDLGIVEKETYESNEICRVYKNNFEPNRRTQVVYKAEFGKRF